MILNIKMDLTTRSRIAENGSSSTDIEHSTYYGVVSRETSRIDFTYEALHSIE